MADKSDIMLFFILNRLLFAINSSQYIKTLEDKEKKCIFESLVSRIKEDEYFTKFDRDTNDNLYKILNYFRDIYKDEESYSKINDAIGVLNDYDDDVTSYVIQFDLRYSTIFNRLYRHKMIRNNFEVVQTLVGQSVANDLTFFYDLDNLDFDEFTEVYGNYLLSISNITYLINAFPHLLKDYKFLIKISDLLDHNKSYAEKDSKNNDVLYASSERTLRKIDKVLKRIK